MIELERAIRNCAATMLAAMYLAMVGMAITGCTVTHIHRFEFDAPKPATTQASTPFAGFVEQLSDERTEK